MPSANRMNKEEMVKQLHVDLAPANAAVVALYSGLTVAGATKLRSDLRKKQVGFRVIKNTLAQRAVEGTALEVLKPAFKGTTALAYTAGDPVAMAKALVDFAKTNEHLKIFAGVLSGKYIEKKEIEALAQLPSREVLLTRLVWALKGPQSGLVYTLSGVLRKLVYALDAVRREKEKQGGEAK